jgi:hypothetical protein
MFVYVTSDKYVDEHGVKKTLFTVGHYDGKGFWVAESDHNNQREAIERCHYLNGGKFNV